MRLGAIPCPGTSLLVSKGEGALPPPPPSRRTDTTHPKLTQPSLLLPVDLKFRAGASQAKAFIGDAESCARFGEVAAETGVSLIFQARTPGDGGLGQGRKDFQAAIDAVPSGTKCEAPEGHRKTDLALIFFTSGTTGAPKMVLLEVRTPRRGGIVLAQAVRLT